MMTADIQGLQFIVTNTTFLPIEDGSNAEVSITFQRKIMYHITNTYLPTLSLLVIVESTLFIDDSRLDVAVSLSLTTMLVVYTFYQSISLTIPKTTYLKFIDYWLIFCLLVPFVIFLIETAWYLDESRLEKFKQGHDVSLAWAEEEKGNKHYKKYFYRKTVKVLVPLITLFLTCIYIFIAFFIYK